MSRLETKILGLIHQANDQWHLFSTQEPILVAVSGGKDSLVLLHLIEEMKLPFKAVHIRLSKRCSLDFIKQNNLQEIIVVIESNILEEIANKKNHCFSCSRQRRKLILEYADREDIKKIAMGHHRDDVVETLVMNMLYSREISTLNPSQILFKGKFEIIRPLYLVPEQVLLSLSKEKNMIIAKPACYDEEKSKRKYIKKLIDKLQTEHPSIDIRDNLFSSLNAIKQDFLPFSDQ